MPNTYAQQFFSTSQCLLHQLTHFVNFSKPASVSQRKRGREWETLGRSFSVDPLHIQRSLPPVDHHHHLYRICSVARLFSSLDSVRFIAQFECEVYDTRCAAQLERFIRIRYNVCVHFPLQPIQIRFIDYCSDIINFYGVVVFVVVMVVLLSLLRCSVSLTFDLQKSDSATFLFRNNRLFLFSVIHPCTQQQ